MKRKKTNSKHQFVGVGPGKQVAVGTGEFEDIDCRMVLKSIGYKSVPVNGLPFDHGKGKKQKRILWLEALAVLLCLRSF
ncbi:hypothetical protein Pint_13221 [Pistacia integerrima]|uniref:Uncharacterized protein n=1 Tax=Pistacia integerrima TaxID=434235 RepID=A0ACC0Y6S7_9ROSI|nr:hypothetical protein Pint_13221 [Pistacia integerrima]